MSQLPYVSTPIGLGYYVNNCSGAGDGTRTRDNLLGRQELYQLSYPRDFEANFGPDRPKFPLKIWLSRNSFFTPRPLFLIDK